MRRKWRSRHFTPDRQAGFLGSSNKASGCFDSKVLPLSHKLRLGKEHAGRKVLVENPEPGVWVIRTVTIIPDNEGWLHEPAVKKSIGKALAWASKNPAKESNLAALKVKKAQSAKRKEPSA